MDRQRKKIGHLADEFWKAHSYKGENTSAIQQQKASAQRGQRKKRQRSELSKEGLSIKVPRIGGKYRRTEKDTTNASKNVINIYFELKYDKLNTNHLQLLATNQTINYYQNFCLV